MQELQAPDSLKIHKLQKKKNAISFGAILSLRTHGIQELNCFLDRCFVTASKQVSSMSSLARQVQLSFCWEVERWQKLPTMAADESMKKRFF